MAAEKKLSMRLGATILAGIPMSNICGKPPASQSTSTSFWKAWVGMWKSAAKACGEDTNLFAFGVCCWGSTEGLKGPKATCVARLSPDEFRTKVGGRRWTTNKTQPTCKSCPVGQTFARWHLKDLKDTA